MALDVKSENVITFLRSAVETVALARDLEAAGSVSAGYTKDVIDNLTDWIIGAGAAIVEALPPEEFTVADALLRQLEEMAELYG